MEPQFIGPGMNTGEMIPIVGMVLGFLLLLLLALGFMVIAFVKAIKSGGSTRRLRELDANEAEEFQALQRGFQRMEERIDSLETLLMGRSQKRSYDREFE